MKGTKTLIAAGAVILIFFVILLNPRRSNAIGRGSIINNLRIIESAKDQWALENKKDADAIPTESDVAPYLKNNQIPAPLIGEKYHLNSVNKPATATLPPDRALGSIPKGGTINLP